MFAPKRLKTLNENDERSTIDAESGFHSQVDLTSTISTEYSLPAVRRKSLATRRASFQQLSFNSPDTQASSGYSSLLSQSSSNRSIESNESSSYLPRSSRTPKKRKSDISESDENFYNSFQFVSPLKKRKKDDGDKNCAKLVLREKSSSANVILSSTPIRNNNTKSKWGKFKTFHAEKPNLKTLDDEEAAENNEKLSKDNNSIVPKPLAENSSLNISCINFSNVSFDLTQNNVQCDAPANVEDLWTGDIKSQSRRDAQKNTLSPKRKTQESLGFKCLNERRHFYDNCEKFNILGRLYAKNDLALKEILSYLDPKSLVSLSHVSKTYRQMIKSNKIFETKRQNYLKTHRAIKENKIPSKVKTTLSTTQGILPSDRKRRTAFGVSNTNQKRQKTNVTTTNATISTPPVSPSSRRFRENQQVVQSHPNASFKKCPKCHRPSRINSIEIRNSPRKMKPSYKLLMSPTTSTSTGRVQKKKQTFLSKTSIESFLKADDRLYVTLPNLEDESSRSPKSSSSGCEFESPNSSGDDVRDTSKEIYEYAICTSAACSFKFCVKCNCKYHPKRICGDLSPPSPSRYSRPSAACTRASLKSLKRLAY